MNKKIPYIVLGIVILLIVIIYSLQIKPTAPTEKPLPSKESVVQTQEEVDKIKNEAKDSQDTSLCEKLVKEEDKISCRDNVFLMKAVAEGNSVLCGQIKSEGTKSQCNDSLIMTEAVGKKDPSLCQEMSNEHARKQCEEYLSGLK